MRAIRLPDFQAITPSHAKHPSPRPERKPPRGREPYDRAKDLSEAITHMLRDGSAADLTQISRCMAKPDNFGIRLGIPATPVEVAETVRHLLNERVLVQNKHKQLQLKTEADKLAAIVAEARAKMQGAMGGDEEDEG